MLVIIADDLTGALDTAAPFAARGLHTEVALTVEAVTRGVAKAPEVLSINLASREKSDREAFQAASRVMELLPPGIRLFKKIDSRLKGHVAAELDAIPFRHALVAPAIPAFGRVVRDGHVQGFGVVEPISVAGALRHHASRSRIVDAESEQDLQVALAEADAEGIDLLVGARGLAEALARDMTGRADAELVRPPTGNGLFVIGSHDRITLEQMDRLRGLSSVHAVAAPNGILASAVPEDASQILVQATPGKTVISSDDVAQNLASSVHPELTERAETLLLCGGATAEAVLARMGIECFRLQGECLPGLGLAYAGKQCIIAKSGGFGPPETLVHLAQALHKGMD
ncbi:four-carbon acid sugar kinase family protein [Rhizobium sp. RU36D]|uniref:four-carbon acid sugar kinase family protein n=1 Tax=Rhizobium sp. RU36D TaxID=1907415 RepID=UPI0009D80FED|nr:four-carbon acid sugar kinase family protein [Rhizobium sp. RU36D]SMD00985.1 Uncharacterized conserved protein YgbK, DUF1537 family [Rhizobium sp. RU36D]